MRIGHEYYVNTVGTFGEGSAGYWWSRLAACIHRLLYHVGAADAWGLLFADDSLWPLPLLAFWNEAALLMLVLCMLRLPLSWHKTRAALDVDWVGFSIRWSCWTVGMVKGRLQDLEERAREILDRDSGSPHSLVVLAHKLVHVAQALPQVRPLLQPLFACIAATAGHRRVAWPLAVKAMTATA